MNNKKYNLRILGNTEAVNQPKRSIRHEVKSIRRAQRHALTQSNKNLKKFLHEDCDDIENGGKKKVLENVFKGSLENVLSLIPSCVHIYLSSTFPDFKDERNSLMSNAYPLLKAKCAELRMEFKFFDMFWGIADEICDIHDHKFLCLDMLRKCQQHSLSINFLLLLGNRYGNSPLAREISTNEFEIISSLASKIFPHKRNLLQDWYCKDTNAIPTIYVLRPISCHFPAILNRNEEESFCEARSNWLVVEENLRKIFRITADACLELGSLSEDQNIFYQLSLTAQEANVGLFGVENPSHKCCVYLRDLEGIHSNEATFIDTCSMENGGKTMDTVKSTLMQKLRTNAYDILTRNSSNPITIKVPWKAEQVGMNEDYLINFTSKVIDCINGFIENVDLSDKYLYEDFIISEILQHLNYAAKCASFFYGRLSELSKVRQWIINPRWQLPIIIHGESGVGKSMLISKIADLAPKWLGNDCTVIMRFLGTSAQSGSAQAVLQSLCQQIAVVYKLTLKNELLLSISNAAIQFSRLIRAASARCGRAQPMLILLDAVDQLDTNSASSVLQWLPRQMPPYVTLIISGLSGTPHLLSVNEQMCKGEDNLVELKPFRVDEVALFVEAQTVIHQRRLDGEQLQFVLRVLQRNPMPNYMQIVLNHALQWHSFDPINGIELGDCYDSSVTLLLKSLEIKHGLIFVQFALGYITLGLNGLSEMELDDALSCNDDVLNELFRFHDPPMNGIIRIPEMHLSRFKNDMAPYLIDRITDGKITRHWCHRLIKQIAYDRYATGNKYQQLHKHLAELFMFTSPVKRTIELRNSKRCLTIPLADRLVTRQSLSVNNKRKMRSMCHHLVHSQDFDMLESQVVCNLDFLRVYIEAFGVDHCITMLQECITYNLQCNAVERYSFRAVHDCLVYSQNQLKCNSKWLSSQILGQLKDFQQSDGKGCEAINDLCRQCEAGIQLSAEFNLQPIFASFPSSFGALKWCQEDVLSILDVSQNESLVLALTQVFNHQHNKLSVFDLNTLEVLPEILLDAELISAKFSFKASAIYVLLKEKFMVYDTSTGCLVVQHNTLGNEELRLNVCFDVSCSSKELALAGTDKVGIFNNRYYKQDLESTSFAWDRTLSLRNSINIATTRFLNNDETPVLVVIYTNKDNEVILNSFDHESKEMLGSVVFTNVNIQRGVPCAERNLLALDTAHIFVAFNDASAYCIDVLSSAIVWCQVETINPEYLRTVRPQLRSVQLDRLHRRVFLLTSYGEYSWLRIFDCQEKHHIFSQRSTCDLEAIGGAAHGESENVLILGGRNGNIVAYDVKEAKSDKENVSRDNPFRERFVNKEEVVEEDDKDDDDLMGQNFLRKLARERAAEAAKLLWRPDEVWRPFFHGHERAIKYLFYRQGLVFALSEDNLFKAWHLMQVEKDRRIYPTLSEVAELQYEKVVGFDVSCKGDSIFTSGSNWLREWRIDDGSLLSEVPLTFENSSSIYGLQHLRMCHEDCFVIGECKDKLVAVETKSGVVQCCISKPLHWTKSPKDNTIYCVSTFLEETTNFQFSHLKIPKFELVHRELDLRAPHPGIDEGVMGLTINYDATVAVLHWGRHGQPWFEAWAIDLQKWPSDGKAVLLACRDKTEKATQRSVRANRPLYKPMRSLATLNRDQFLLGCDGDIPVWTVKQQEAHMQFVPHVDAWLKQSLLEQLYPNENVQHDTDKSSTQPEQPQFQISRSTDEYDIIRHPITALAVFSSESIIVSGATNGTIVIWRLKETGSSDAKLNLKCRSILRNAHTSEICCLSICPNGKFLASGALDKRICLINVSHGQILTDVFVHMYVKKIQFTANIRHIVSTCSNGSEEKLMIFKICDCQS